MNYYQLTSGLDSDSDSDGEVGWMVTGVTKHGDQEHKAEPTNLQQALQECLTKDTLEDLRREYTKNTVVAAVTESVEETNKQEKVVLRRKSSRNTYGRRASQRFSKILEGVTSLVSLAPTNNQKTDQVSETKQDEEAEKASTSLPYWVEASQNICKEDVKEESEAAGSDSGYCSIADSAHSESIVQMEADGINEKISEIFDSMHLEEEADCANVKLRESARNGADGLKQRRKTVSGYFQDWASWMGSVEARHREDQPEEKSKVQDVKKRQNVSRKSSSVSCEDCIRSDKVDDLWSTWDTILIEWNKGGKKKIPAVKDLARRGIPQHLRGISWQMLSGAHNSPEKSKYLDYLKTESACEKAIHRDIARTYPEHDFFKKKDGIGQEALFNVMKAYSIHDREVGYCQGSAFIVGLLLMQMPEEEAFAVLVKMMEDYAMREMFKPSMAELGLCMYQLDILIQEQIPDLYVHFQSQAVHTNLYASRWFLTLFTSSLPLSISYRIMDCFLSEGREVIFRIALALLVIAKNDLLLRDMEGVTKHFQKEMPVKFEADPDSVFSLAFSLNINPKKMKRIEKEYMTMKSKEAEDEMEIRRLRTENRLVRQKMDMLEQESSDLADRLLQDQVTRAEEEENCFLMRQELKAAEISKQQTLQRMEEADIRIRKVEQELEETKKEALKREKEHEQLLQTKEQEIKNLKEKIPKTVNDSVECHLGDKTVEEKENYIEQVTLIDSESEVAEWKKISEESKKDLQELRSKIRDLKNIWKLHLQKYGGHEELKPTTSAPKKLLNSFLEGTSEVGRLEEELISSRLREVDTLAELKEWKIKSLEIESQAKASRNQLTRQDDIVQRLQEELDQFKRNTFDLKSQLRESQIKFCNLEGKLKDEQLMGRIKDAENTQNLAELRHQISSLELKNEEATLGDLNWCLEDAEDTRELQDRIEHLTAEVNRLSVGINQPITISPNCDCNRARNLESSFPTSDPQQPPLHISEPQPPLLQRSQPQPNLLQRPDMRTPRDSS